MTQIPLTDLPDIVGLIGVAVVLIAYFLLHANFIESEGRSYSFLNLIGAILVLYSLYYYWNTPAVIMEVAWIILSLYGFIKASLKSKN